MSGSFLSRAAARSEMDEQSRFRPIRATWLAPIGAGLLGFAGTAFLWRRLGGALAAPLNGPSLLLVGALAVVVAVLVRRANQSRAGQTGFPFHRPLGWGISAAVVMIGIALSLPATNPIALLCFWGLLAVEEAWAWRRAVLRLRSSRLQAADEDARGASSDALNDRDRGLPETAIQHLTRSRLPDGSETLSGWVRVPWVAGQRVASVHVAFCPPFPSTPEVRVEQCEGPAAQIKTVQVLPYGVRFDLKLNQSGPSDAEAVLKFSAESRPACRLPK